MIEMPVVIATPYLYKNMADEYCYDYVKIQRDKYSYEDNNFSTLDELVGGNIKVNLLKLRCNENVLNEANAPLYVIGSTRAAEELVEEQKGSGKVIARFSVFYSNPSGYSGDYPEETGYAIDIPKSIETITSFLTHLPTMIALNNRDFDGIIKELDNLNKNLEQPVLATPYLKEALRWIK